MHVHGCLEAPPDIQMFTFGQPNWSKSTISEFFPNLLWHLIQWELVLFWAIWWHNHCIPWWLESRGGAWQCHWSGKWLILCIHKSVWLWVVVVFGWHDKGNLPSLSKGSDNIRLLTRANYSPKIVDLWASWRCWEELMFILKLVTFSGASDKDPPTPYSANTPIAREENLPTRLMAVKSLLRRWPPALHTINSFLNEV